MNITRPKAAGLLAGAPAIILKAARKPHPMERYNVVWNSPSKDASGVRAPR